MNNFVADSSTMITQVNGATIAVNRDGTGLVSQTSKDGNGGFIVNQVWPDTQSYTNNQAPQAATLPTDSGFATLSIQPNGAGILTQVDQNGRVIGEAVMNTTGIVSNINYAAGNASISDGRTGLSMTTVVAQDATLSLLFLGRKLLGMTKKANSGSFSLAFAQSNGSWKFTTFLAGGTKTENTITNVIQQSDPNFPELSEILQTARNFRAARSYNDAGFTGAFLNDDTTNAQARAANQIIAAPSSTSSAVLGVKTKLTTKEVLATENIPLSSPVSLPGGTATHVQVVTSTWTDDQGTHYGGHTQLVGTNIKGEQGQPVADSQPISEIVSRPGSPAEPPSVRDMAANAAQEVGGSIQESGQQSGSRGGQQTQQSGAAQGQQSGTGQQTAPAGQQANSRHDPGTTRQVTINETVYDVHYNAQGIPNNIREVTTDGSRGVEYDRRGDGTWSVVTEIGTSKQFDDGGLIDQIENPNANTNTSAQSGTTGQGTSTGSLSRDQVADAARTAGAEAAQGIAGNAPLSGIAAGWAAYTTARENGMSHSDALNTAHGIANQTISQEHGSTSDRTATYDAIDQFAQSERGIDAPLSWDTISSNIDVGTVEGANAALATAVASEAIQDGQRDIAAENLSATVDAFNRGEATFEDVQRASEELDRQQEDVTQAEGVTQQAQENLSDVTGGDSAQGEAASGASAESGGQPSTSEAPADSGQGSFDASQVDSGSFGDSNAGNSSDRSGGGE